MGAVVNLLRRVLSPVKSALLGAAVAAALAVALLAGAGLEWAVPEREEPMARRPQGWVRVAAAAVLALLALWGGILSAPLLVALIALVFVGLVAVDVYARLKRPMVENAVVATK